MELIRMYAHALLQSVYRIAGNFRGFVVGGLTTNILPTNEATLPTFTYNPSSNHEN